MKKMMKKITSIILSIILMLGCIPCFGNVASADGNITYIQFTEPKSFEELMNLKKDDISITASKFKSFAVNRTHLTALTTDPSDSGVCLLVITLEYDDDDPANLVDALVFNVSNVITKNNYISTNDAIANIDQIEYAVLTDYKSGKLTFARKYYFGKSLDITANTAVGTQVANVYLGSNLDDNILSSQIYLLEDLEALLDNSDVLETNKRYRMEVQYGGFEDCVIYDKVAVNNVKLPHYSLDLPDNNYYKISYDDIKGIVVSYEFSTMVQSSSGSKRYKAEDNDTAEKVSGTGKKGSKRTITPNPGKKVKEVIVTDKKGNPIEVTMNEDGTFEFIQPASNVNIEVVYAQREITLEAGTTNVILDGETISTDSSLIINDDKKLVPIRLVTECLGGNVEWKEEEPDLVKIKKDDKVIDISLSSSIINVNGSEIAMSTAPIVVNNRTYLPFDFYQDVFDLYIETYNESMKEYLKLIESNN